MERRRDDFELILESCLDQLQAGQDTIDSILARYPDFETELKPLLESAQWVANQKEMLDPRPGFVAASRWRLVEQIRTVEAQKPPTLWDRLKSIFVIRPNSVSPQFALGVMLLLLFFCVAAGTTFSSQSSIPGDILYPVKLGWEEAALALTPGDLGDARLNVEFVQRRLSEIKSLAFEGRFDEIPEAVTGFEDRVSAATTDINELARRSPAAAVSLAKTLEETLTDQTDFIASISNDVPQDTKDQLARMQLASQVGLTAVQNVLAMEINLPGSGPTATPTATNSVGASGFATPTLTPTPTSDGGSPAPAPGVSTQGAPSEATPSATPVPPSSTSSAPETPTSTQVPPSSTPVPPSQTPVSPTRTPIPPTDTPEPTNTPKPTNTPTPTMPPPPSPVTPTSPPPPTDTPRPTNTPKPTNTPTDTPEPATPTSPPRPSHTPKPTKTDKP